MVTRTARMVSLKAGRARGGVAVVRPPCQAFAGPSSLWCARRQQTRGAGHVPVGSRITIESIPLEIRDRQAPRASNGLQEVRDSAERERIRQALDRTRWNISGAARLLGAERTSLHKRIRALGLKRE